MASGRNRQGWGQCDLEGRRPLIATVPAADDTVARGNNIFFGHSDTNATSSTDVNDVSLLFTLIDNVRVVPEPGTMTFVALGMSGLLAVRRRATVR